MYKSHVDWFPCLNLGHDKVNMATLQAADERAARTEQRRKRMEESYARASESSEVDASTNEETVTSCNFSSVETQTDSVKHDDRQRSSNYAPSKSKLIMNAVIFLLKVTFYLMMERFVTIRGCQTPKFYCGLLDF